MIISGGENIYPAEVEQCIERHPGVTAAAVIGKPDERWGETPLAFVVLDEPGAFAEAELAQWTREHLAGYKQPTEWVFVDSFPRTSLGKVQKHHLQALHR
jgi:acyl-CoA synthetase (AMP-forming)/AMP-acid ligase II